MTDQVFDILAQVLNNDCALEVMEYVHVNQRNEHKARMKDSLAIINLWGNYNENTCYSNTINHPRVFRSIVMVHAIDCALIASKLNDGELKEAIFRSKYLETGSAEQHRKYVRNRIRLFAYMYASIILAHCVYTGVAGAFISGMHYHRFPGSDILDIVEFGNWDDSLFKHDSPSYTCCRNVQNKRLDALHQLDVGVRDTYSHQLDVGVRDTYSHQLNASRKRYKTITLPVVAAAICVVMFISCRLVDS